MAGRISQWNTSRGNACRQAARRSPFSNRSRAALAAIAEAVQHAHEAGLVPRDLKHENILLNTQSDVSALKIADFGLAKHLQEVATFIEGPKTLAGAVLGTPGYMAPEQASGRIDEIGPATDVYALGAILYECLTGQAPFRASTMYETLVQIAQAEPTSPRKLSPGVPRDLEVICLKCLRKQPSSRYPTAAGLLDDLRRFLDGKPIAARALSPVARAGRWLQRHRELAYLAGGVVIAASLSLAALLFWPEKRTITTEPGVSEAKMPLDLRFVPDDAWGFVTVRSADLWALKEPHDLIKQIAADSDPPFTLDALGAELERLLEFIHATSARHARLSRGRQLASACGSCPPRWPRVTILGSATSTRFRQYQLN